MQSLSRFSQLRPIAPGQDRDNSETPQRPAAGTQVKVEEPLDASGSRSDAEDVHASPRKQTFERILTHTWIIQPEGEGQRSPDKDASSSTPEKAVLYEVQLNHSLNLIASGEHIIGHLPPVKSSSQLRSKRSGKRLLTAPDWFASAKHLEASKHVRLVSTFARHGGPANDQSAKPKAKAHFLPYHFRLTIEIYLDMRRLSDELDDAALMAKSRLIHTAFVESGWRTGAVVRIEHGSNATYSTTDIEWFYACLQRPPTTNIDRKGKGRMRDSVIRPPGLQPILCVICERRSYLLTHCHSLPFQSRSLQWMLQREGRRVAGLDESGEHHELAPVASSDDAQRIESSLWRAVTLDSGSRLWVNGITCELAEQAPMSTFDDPFEGSMAAEEMGKVLAPPTCAVN